MNVSMQNENINLHKFFNIQEYSIFPRANITFPLSLADQEPQFLILTLQPI